MAATQRKTTTEKVVRIPLDQLYFMEHYPIAQREDDSFHEIVNSVRENGVLQPAIVRPLESGGYKLTAPFQSESKNKYAYFFS